MSDEPLTWDGPSIEDFLEAFAQSTAKTRREAKVVMRATAKDIMTASQQMCPVDTHRLEEAHHIDVIRLNADEIELVIAVDGDVDGRDVGEYAMIQHETLLPFGSGTPDVAITKTGKTPSPPTLGPKSVEKDLSNPPDRPVGGKFLERAADLYQEKLIERMTEILPSAEDFK